MYKKIQEKKEMDHCSVQRNLQAEEQFNICRLWETYSERIVEKFCHSPGRHQNLFKLKGHQNLVIEYLVLLLLQTSSCFFSFCTLGQKSMNFSTAVSPRSTCHPATPMKLTKLLNISPSQLQSFLKKAWSLSPPR